VGRRHAACACKEGRLKAKTSGASEAGEHSLNDEQQHPGGRRELLEKTIAKILHRHCNFGWANYYIPSEKFPSLIEELVEVMSPGGQAGHDELVQFFLGVQRLPSIQERVKKLEQEFFVYKRG
jgi:hypothetical protein